MADAPYPDLITTLPEADIPFPGVQGWIAQSENRQVVFFDIEPLMEVPAHSHGEQWGIVIEGEMELTIGAETRRYRPGDTYHIPAGVEHRAKFLTRFRVIDVFADKDRYSAK